MVKMGVKWRVGWYIYIYIYAVVCCRFFFLILLLLLLLFLFPLWIPRSLALSLHSSAVHPKPRPACMHACILLHIHSLVTFFLLLMMRTYLSSSVPPCQEKISTSSWGASIYFLHNFSFFLVRNYFSLASKRRERYEALDSLFLLLSSYSLSQLLRALHTCIWNRERERIILFTPQRPKRERESTQTPTYLLVQNNTMHPPVSP